MQESFPFDLSSLCITMMGDSSANGPVVEHMIGMQEIFLTSPEGRIRYEFDMKRPLLESNCQSFLSFGPSNTFQGQYKKDFPKLLPGEMNSLHWWFAITPVQAYFKCNRKLIVCLLAWHLVNRDEACMVYLV